MMGARVARTAEAAGGPSASCSEPRARSSRRARIERALGQKKLPFRATQCCTGRQVRRATACRATDPRAVWQAHDARVGQSVDTTHGSEKERSDELTSSRSRRCFYLSELLTGS